jgi:hypothetical protein
MHFPTTRNDQGKFATVNGTIQVVSSTGPQTVTQLECWQLASILSTTTRFIKNSSEIPMRTLFGATGVLIPDSRSRQFIRTAWNAMLSQYTGHKLMRKSGDMDVWWRLTNIMRSGDSSNAAFCYLQNTPFYPLRIPESLVYERVHVPKGMRRESFRSDHGNVNVPVSKVKLGTGGKVTFRGRQKVEIYSKPEKSGPKRLSIVNTKSQHKKKSVGDWKKVTRRNGRERDSRVKIDGKGKGKTKRRDSQKNQKKKEDVSAYLNIGEPESDDLDATESESKSWDEIDNAPFSPSSSDMEFLSAARPIIDDGRFADADEEVVQKMPTPTYREAVVSASVPDVSRRTRASSFDTSTSLARSTSSGDLSHGTPQSTAELSARYNFD